MRRETIADAAARGADSLAQNAAAKVEARSLLLHSLGFDDYAELLAKGGESLPPAAAAEYDRCLRERMDGRPLAYILGWREFYGRRFQTTPVALIPRMETERLVEAALRHAPADAPSHILDLGTGCGAIGISIALARPRAIVWLTDVDAQTLALAKRNAARHKADNVRFRRADWYAAVAADCRLDVIVSNPPYVAEDERGWRRGDLRFEPVVALAGGADGLSSLRRVIAGAPRHLRRGGVLLIEHAPAQSAEVRRLSAAAGFCGMRHLRDLSGAQRVTLAAKP